MPEIEPQSVVYAKDMSRSLQVRVKICGIRSVDDAAMVMKAGADAIGLNFVGGPRQITIEQADHILAVVKPPCTAVALVELQRQCCFSSTLESLAQLGITHLQAYGPLLGECIADLSCKGFKVIAPFQVTGCDFAERVSEELNSWPQMPDIVLLDAHHPTLKGGTGKTADWDSIVDAIQAGGTAGWPPIMLAGGLNPANVNQAVNVVAPWAVDVSSGVEYAPGRKAPELVAEFIHQAGRQPPSLGF